MSKKTSEMMFFGLNSIDVLYDYETNFDYVDHHGNLN